MTASRLDQIAPFRVMQLMERAKALEAQGKKVVHFEVGEPDFATAEPIVQAGQAALAEGRSLADPAAYSSRLNGLLVELLGD